MRSRSLKQTAMILCAVFVLAVFFSIGLQVVHAGHHCADRRCPICVAYSGAQFVMRILGLVAVAQALRLTSRLAPMVPDVPCCPHLLSASPVALRNRLND